MKDVRDFLFWVVVLALGGGTVLNLQKIQKPNTPTWQTAALHGAVQNSDAGINTELNSSIPRNSPILPIEEFHERITKKPFGIYITPKTSPVQPDKFAGYHTGVDVEYEDVPAEIPVKAVTDGKVILSKIASGYGGVLVLRHNVNGEDLFVLYGHLDPKSMLAHRAEAQKGQVIGFLGDGKTEETDGARKHLHFAILKKNELDIRGYVQNKKELEEGWHDPMEFYRN